MDFPSPSNAKPILAIIIGLAGVALFFFDYSKKLYRWFKKRKKKRVFAAGVCIVLGLVFLFRTQWVFVFLLNAAGLVIALWPTLIGTLRILIGAFLGLLIYGGLRIKRWFEQKNSFIKAGGIVCMVLGGLLLTFHYRAEIREWLLMLFD